MLEIRNDELMLRPGMFVKAAILSEKRDQTIVIPKETIISRQNGDEEWRFGEVLLIAPDVDRDLFERDLLPALEVSPSRITLYKSEDDFPLDVSRQVNQYNVLGAASVERIAYRAIETIDVTKASTVFRGHSYYRKEPSVLADIHYLINGRKGADQRPFLQALEVNGGRYWSLQPMPAD